MALLAPRKNDADLFAETTMSFGEHLEELRVCLWRAVLGLVIGFCIGLTFGKQAVLLIQAPLEKALKAYYATITLERFNEATSHLDPEMRGLVPYQQKDLEARIAEGMIFEMRYVDASDLNRALDLPSKSDTPRNAPVDTPMPTASPTSTAAPTATPSSTPVPTSTAVKPVSGDEVTTSAAPTTAMGSSDLLKNSNLVPLLIWQEQKDDDRTRPTTLSAQEAFMIWIKASFVLGALISAPWVFYQIWLFVAAGLYHHERKYIYIFLPFSLGLFFLGAATAYLFVFEPVLQFLFDFNKWLGMHPDPRMNEWLGFVLLMPLGFGVSFQLPLVMLFLERIGVFKTNDYIEKWRIAVLAIFIISAVLTPADPYSIFLMAVPLTFLYFGGILMTIYLPRLGGRPQAT